MGAGGRRGSFNHTQRHWRSGALPVQHIRACCPAGDPQLEACSVQTTAHAGTRHNPETPHLPSAVQPEFTASVLMEAHARGLTTCIDTTGQGLKHSRECHGGGGAGAPGLGVALT